MVLIVLRLCFAFSQRYLCLNFPSTPVLQSLPARVLPAIGHDRIDVCALSTSGVTLG